MRAFILRRLSRRGLRCLAGPSASTKSASGFELAVRLGINSGDIVVGTIGDRYRRYHTATGYSVALARRMEAIAEVDRIYLTQATVELVERHLLVRALGALAVKGARTPVNVFELVGTAPSVDLST